MSELTRVVCPIEGKQINKQTCWDYSQEQYYRRHYCNQGCRSRFKLCRLCVQEAYVENDAVVDLHPLPGNEGMCAWHGKHPPGAKRPAWQHALAKARRETGHSIADTPVPKKSRPQRAEAPRRVKKSPPKPIETPKRVEKPPTREKVMSKQEELVAAIKVESDPLSKGEMLRDLAGELDNSIVAAAAACGKTVAWARNFTMLTGLPADLKNALNEGKVGVTKTREYLRAPAEEQKALREQLLAETAGDGDDPDDKKSEDDGIEDAVEALRAAEAAEDATLNGVATKALLDALDELPELAEHFCGQPLQLRVSDLVEEDLLQHHRLPQGAWSTFVQARELLKELEPIFKRLTGDED